MCENNRPVFDESKVLKDNAMLKHYPHLFFEWDFEKNNEIGLDVYKITRKNGKKAWWIGECGHPYFKAVSHKTAGQGCPYCANGNSKVLVGFNDLWTTSPKKAEMLWNLDDGYKYSDGSNKKVEWKCTECGSKIPKRAIVGIVTTEIHCSMCSDGISYPEKVAMSLLNQLEIQFLYNHTFEWAKNRYYDFYIPSLKCIIEVHGEQHYRETNRGRTLEEEQENDRLKEELAQKKGILHYFSIDCRLSDLDYIKKSYIESGISNILDVDCIDWEECNKVALKTFVREASNLWNGGLRNINEIAIILKVSRPTARKYLRQAAEQKWCDYNPKEILTERSIRNGLVRRKRVIQLSKEGVFIKEWSYADEASTELKISRSSITNVCNGKSGHAGNFLWKYAEDYYKKEVI